MNKPIRDISSRPTAGSISNAPIRATGWLFFFVVWLRVLFPLSLLMFFFGIYSAVSGQTALLIAVALLFFMVVSYSLGSKVLVLERGFRDTATAFLIFLLIGAIPGLAILFSLLYLSEFPGLEHVVARTLGILVGGAIQPALWLAYVQRSKRVKLLSASDSTDEQLGKAGEGGTNPWKRYFWIPLAIATVMPVATYLTETATSAPPSASNAVKERPYEVLSNAVRAGMQASNADLPTSSHAFSNSMDAANWLTVMADRIGNRIPELRTRLDLLRTIHYEAARAGLDPQLVLAMIEVLSNFNKFEAKESGPLGYMQVHPNWVQVIGKDGDNLFNLRTNLRYGCVILRHYLDMEGGNLSRALNRYRNQILGDLESEHKQDDRTFPNEILKVMHANWTYQPRPSDEAQSESTKATQSRSNK